jgi:hypothetical protein
VSGNPRLDTNDYDLNLSPQAIHQFKPIGKLYEHRVVS